MQLSKNAGGSAKLTLVVLAAGAGSRYGGLKQLEPVGPGAATLIDYTAFDAKRAGFERIVLVIRPETHHAFIAHFDSRLQPHLDVAICFQRPAASPSGSSGSARLWGTAHAVLAAASEIEGPFAVANADDFYGTDALHAVREFLSDSDEFDFPMYAVVGYPLAETLSDAGPVSRALCHRGSNDELLDIVETEGIERDGGNARYTDSNGISQTLEGDTLVSMNLWAFYPSILEQLRVRFEEHLRLSGKADRSEFQLPSVVRNLLKKGLARAKILRTSSSWFGLTHRLDKGRVEGKIRSLIEAGQYPRSLWG